MTHEQPISNRTFKHLRKVTRQAGIQIPDEDVHDMGRRLESICFVLSKSDESSKPDLGLTDQEVAALQVIVDRVKASKLVSSRNISNALGYASSRSGHLLIQRLLNKGFLIMRRGQVELKGDVEFERDSAVL